ncbi:Luciferase-like, subgroup [Mycolicibacterium rhodesiae JS60]|nr:Luciferase-like, subgroup [Mycolicibacterium rhodesiae JS60]
MMRDTVTVRAGLGLGVGRMVEGRSDLIEIVDLLEELGFDSLWTSEVLGSHAPDALATLAFAAGRTERLKFGTSVLSLPGWSPTRLAKYMATLDQLSAGRFFPVVGLGTADADALAAQGVDRRDRGPMTEEMIPLLRRIWASDVVNHVGDHYQVQNYRPHIHPMRRGLSVWLGGRSAPELQRVGRLADGWLASFATPAEIACSVPIIEEAAAVAGRTIDSDHYGTLLLYSLRKVDDNVRDFIRWRRPDQPVGEVFPEGADALNALLESFVAAGATKFVLVPAARPDSWEAELAALMEHVTYVRGAEVVAAR